MSSLSSDFHPLVSVIMPAFNAGKTIFKALCSLKIQTYKFWECIVVDDGSTDNTFEIVKNFNDARIKCIRLATNMGRGYARQVALDNSTGVFLAMLDADDWIHPLKLEKQVEAFIDHPEIDLVSCGLGVIDKGKTLFGVRAKGDFAVKTFSFPGKVPVAHASSMLRMDSAKQFNYDKSFLLAQDVDFLRRYLLDKKYLILEDVFYYYTEHESSSLKKISFGYLFNIKGFSKFFLDYPVVISVNIIDQLMKLVISNVCGIFGLFQILLKNRTSPPTSKDLSYFEQCETALLSIEHQ
jgi:glycosyltransferase involved in cell wall biosynthesis